MMKDTILEVALEKRFYCNSGVQNVPKERSVVAVKGQQSYQAVSKDRGELTTILAFVNAFGEIVPPTIIHKGQRVQSDWRIDCPTNYDLTCSASGFVNKDLFYVAGIRFGKWLKKHDRLDRNHILLLDGHSSHTFNYPFLSEMKECRVTCFFLPAHCSHLVSRSTDLFAFLVYFIDFIQLGNSFHVILLVNCNLYSLGTAVGLGAVCLF